MIFSENRYPLFRIMRRHDAAKAPGSRKRRVVPFCNSLQGRAATARGWLVHGCCFGFPPGERLPVNAAIAQVTVRAGGAAD